MKRQHESILNEWVQKQPGSQHEIAKKLGIRLGTLKAWLCQGFVPKASMQRIAQKINCSGSDLIHEYYTRRGV